jgi:opacity protein-like surface antigen
MSREGAMMRHFIRHVLGFIVIGVPSLLLGQSDESFNHLTLSVGAGFTTRAGAVARDIDNGGNFDVNSGYFFDRHFGVTGNFMFSESGITRSALDALNEPDGSASIYALTADPTVRLPLGRGFVAYALAGGGYVGRDLHFHKPILVGLASTHMPFMLMPGYASAGSIIDSSGGFDAGGGLNMPSPWRRAKFFLEARYFKGFTSHLNTTAIPITVGIRW